MDIQTMTISELEQLLADATNALYAAKQREATDTAKRRAQVAEAITNLETLIGPATGEPGTDSIRAVRRFDDQTLADNSGLALNLAFHALELVTENALNMARVIAANN